MLCSSALLVAMVIFYLHAATLWTMRGAGGDTLHAERTLRFPDV
jgi:hypothetical protein